MSKEFAMRSFVWPNLFFVMGSPLAIRGPSWPINGRAGRIAWGKIRPIATLFEPTETGHETLLHNHATQHFDLFPDTKRAIHYPVDPQRFMARFAGRPTSRRQLRIDRIDCRRVTICTFPGIARM